MSRNNLPPGVSLNDPNINPPEFGIEDTEIHTWFERDRAHVELRNIGTGKTIAEWWDEAVAEAVEDGFLDSRDWHGSAFEYARYQNLI